MPSKRRRDWSRILDRAREITISYDTPITLRQLHYRLVSEPELGYLNTSTDYKQLSARTAILRREGGFPPLADLTRSITEYAGFSGLPEYLDQMGRTYYRSRTEGQDVVPVIVAEKETLLMQLADWFAVPYGVPVVPLRGYHSESLERDVIRRFDDDGVYVALYVGDFDPTGSDIERNTRRYVDGLFANWTRVAIKAEHVDTYTLPPQVGKASDPRARGFVAAHGKLVQVEVEALDPVVLRELLTEAFERNWDDAAYQVVMRAEASDRAKLGALIEQAKRDASF